MVRWATAVKKGSWGGQARWVLPFLAGWLAIGCDSAETAEQPDALQGTDAASIKTKVSLGQSCANDNLCKLDGLTCASGAAFPGGACTTTCITSSVCGPTGVCADGYCAKLCSKPSDCRTGYTCAEAGQDRACVADGSGSVTDAGATSDGGGAGDTAGSDATSTDAGSGGSDAGSDKEPTVQDPKSPFAPYPCDQSWTSEWKTDLPADCRCSLNELPQSAALCACGVPGEMIGKGCVIPGASSSGFPIADGGVNVAKLVTGEYFGSLVDGSEIISAIKWQDAANSSIGAVVAVDWTTGARRLISGAVKDPKTGYQQKGDGPFLAELYHVLKGADGAYYAWGKHFPKFGSLPNTGGDSSGAGMAIYRIEPATGARKLHWFWSGTPSVNKANVEAGVYAMCGNGNPSPTSHQYCQPEPQAFAMLPDGSFLTSCIQTGATGPSGTGEGSSIVRISADAKTSCSYVTRSGTGAKNLLFATNQGQIGGGYSVNQDNYRGMTYNPADGRIYAAHFVSASIFRIDPQTGDRERISSAGGAAGAVGKGPDIGYRWLNYDASRNWLWTTGGQSPAITPVRLAAGEGLQEGDRQFVFKCNASDEPIVGLTTALKWKSCITGPITKSNFGSGGAWLLPDGKHMIINHTGVYVKIDLVTGNSYNFSM